MGRGARGAPTRLTSPVAGESGAAHAVKAAPKVLPRGLLSNGLLGEGPPATAAAAGGCGAVVGSAGAHAGGCAAAGCSCGRACSMSAKLEQMGGEVRRGVAGPALTPPDVIVPCRGVCRGVPGGRVRGAVSPLWRGRRAPPALAVSCQSTRTFSHETARTGLAWKNLSSSVVL